ncbi:MAG: RusA family crossover junction endodeoxyribonuclease [Alphaproteobacteria bacterium]|nr:RusA family crossover junction endodeoxyribonuclease [Alphaproteobacteria bacterium SS10]
MLDGGGLFIEIAQITTQRSRLRTVVRETLVDGGWRKAARFDAYDVAILLTVDRLSRRIDADNVAKALLDALTGLVWQDDRQIRRLVVEKQAQPMGAIVPAIQMRAMAFDGVSLRDEFEAIRR